MDIPTTIEIKERLARIEERQLGIKNAMAEINGTTHDINRRVQHLEVFYHKMTVIISMCAIVLSVITSWVFDVIRNLFKG
jgi:hypothetical protein